jgi:LemA protein
VAFADIDAHLKHRHNLIPSLVETVRGFANHERELVLAVTRAQAEAMAAASQEMKLKAEKNLTASLNALFTSAQKMPEIQASSHFVALRTELIECENRITAARRFHNIAVGEYNASSRQWPASMFAKRHGLTKREPFDLGAERTVIDQPAAIAF